MIAVFIFLFLSGLNMGFCTGKGEIHKRCTYGGWTPIEGARVYLAETDTTLYTDEFGWANFSGLEKGWYNVYTDVDDDGLYDETDYINVMEGEIEISINDFPDPPPPPSV